LPDARGAVVNLASGEDTTIRAVVEMISELMDYRGEIQQTVGDPLMSNALRDQQHV